MKSPRQSDTPHIVWGIIVLHIHPELVTASPADLTKGVACTQVSLVHQQASLGAILKHCINVQTSIAFYDLVPPPL